MKKSTKTMALALSCLLMSQAMVAMAAGTDDIQLIVNGETLQLDVPPQIVESRTLVPVRGIFEKLGATVEWKADTQQVIATKDEHVIELAINDVNAVVDGEAVVLDVPAKNIDGRTMVPVRFISEAMDAEVQWDAQTRTVTVTEVEQEMPVQPEQTETEKEPEKIVYNRSNPAPIGVTQTITVHNSRQRYTVEMTLMGFSSGYDALMRLHDVNRFNPDMPEDQNYYLINMQIKVLEVEGENWEGEEKAEINEFDFDCYAGDDSKEYRHAGVVVPEPEVGDLVDIGVNRSGYLCFLIDNDEPAPKISFGTDYNGTGGIWFSLTRE